MSTPFADAVLRLRGTASPEADIVSFHALPWSHGASLTGAGTIARKYDQLFGAEFLATEMSYSGRQLDSFFYPSGPLDRAQRLAAEAFGSDHTFFVTCGTTAANQIAVDALDGPGRRILVDRGAHQSVHVAASRAVARVDYTAQTRSREGRPLLDVPELLATLARPAGRGAPYDAVVLAGSSYDGVLYDLPSLLAECLAASPSTRTFLVDEAWSAVNAFHPDLRPRTALAAARRLDAAGEPVRVLVTHSAHKTMSAARQGSYLHVVGGTDLVEAVRVCLQRQHTTSPSIPILASLDLARAHAEADGARLVQRSIDLAEHTRQVLADDPSLKAAYSVTGPPSGRFLAGDPTKLLIDVSRLGLTGAQARAELFAEHRIHVGYTVAHGILAHFHIGTDESRVDRLVEALRTMAHRRHHRPASASPPRPGAEVDRLVVVYPPGVPLAVPGDVWTVEHQLRVEGAGRDGVDVLDFPAP